MQNGIEQIGNYGKKRFKNMSKDNPILYFSVIIPLYNKEKSVTSTVESVLNQTYSHFELIIVNDGSTDNSLEVVKQFDDPRIRIIEKENGGVSSARNVGIKAAKYEYILPLDADDLWMPFALAEFNALVINFPKAQVFATSSCISQKQFKGLNKQYYVDDFFYGSAVLLAKFGTPMMVTGSVAVKKTCFEEVGYYDENVRHGEDVDLWLRLKDKFKIAKSEIVTMIYRFETENRASLVAEENKIFKNNSSEVDYSDSGKSFLLFKGCNDFMKLFAEKNIFKALRLMISEKLSIYWLFRAMLLYTQYRIFRKI